VPRGLLAGHPRPRTATDFGSSAEANALAVQANGKLVAAGLAITQPSLPDFAVARYRQ